jgi:hypothetical protein
MVCCGGEIGAYIAQPNFHKWELLGALPRTRQRGSTMVCSWLQLD